MPKQPYLTAQEAAAELGVSLATLYAYVSRGLIRSEAAAGSRRARRYRREDVARLKQRQAQRRNPARAARETLHWGLPVLESSLTLIADGRLYYRGQGAVGLAETAVFEQVAELLWSGLVAARAEALARWAPQATPVERIQVVLAVAAGADPAAFDLRPASVAETGQRILRQSLAAVIFPARPTGRRLAEGLQRAWAPDQPDALPIIEAALILCADHELNVSAFTARCVASAGGTPYGVVLAALAALQGHRHGGAVGRAAALLDEVGSPARASAVLNGRLRRGESIPGFGHLLYPEGDPRGQALLDMLMTARSRSKSVRLAKSLVTAAAELIGEKPTIDLALAVIERTLDLPRGAGLALFALGRTAGWIAHALEQYAIGELIRPRATYVDLAPAIAANSD
ncbi:MAG: citrate synthase family protein [Anaerolineales bacterium]